MHVQGVPLRTTTTSQSRFYRTYQPEPPKPYITCVCIFRPPNFHCLQGQKILILTKNQPTRSENLRGGEFSLRTIPLTAYWLMTLSKREEVPQDKVVRGFR